MSIHPSSPSSPSHRYLTPRFKTEFYDVTKWVEDVNRNTQGPYLRYYLRPCPVPHTLVQKPPHFWFDLWFGHGKRELVTIWTFFSAGDWMKYLRESRHVATRGCCWPLKENKCDETDERKFSCFMFYHNFCSVSMKTFLFFKQLHFTLQILISCWFPGAIMAPTVLHLNYSHFIPNFSSSPPLLLPLSLLLPLHVQCHCVSKCLCVGAAALPVTSCAFASVWRHRRPECFGLCSDITTEPQWTKATSLIVSKVYRWLQTQAFLHNKGAHGVVGSVERRPHVNAPTASSLRQIKVTKLSVGTVIYRPSLCLPLPLLVHSRHSNTVGSCGGWQQARPWCRAKSLTNVWCN